MDLVEQKPEHMSAAPAVDHALMPVAPADEWTAEDTRRALHAASRGVTILESWPPAPEDVARECERLARRSRKPIQIAADAIADRKAPPAWLAIPGTGGSHTVITTQDALGWSCRCVVRSVDHAQAKLGHPTSNLSDWPEDSDYHSGPGPAHPRTAARTLVAAPGAPSLCDRAVAA